MQDTEPIERAAVVTGSSRGIGRAIARELAARGMRVVVNCSRPEGLEAAEAVAVSKRPRRSSTPAWPVSAASTCS